MLLRRLTDFILASRLRAMAVAFATSFIPVPGGSVGVLVASLVTLRKGAFEGSLVFCAALAASLASYVFYRNSANAWMLWQVTWIGCALGLLTWLLVLILRRTSSWAIVTELSGLCGILVILGLHLAFPGIQGWWVEQLTAWFHKSTSMIGHFLPDMGSAAMQPEAVSAAWIASFSRYATGFLVTSFLVNLLLQVMIARAWEAAVFTRGLLRQELHAFRADRVAGLLFIIVLVAALMGSMLALDMLPVLLMVFCLAGFCLVHALFALLRRGWVALLFFYAGVVVFFPFSLAIVAIAGLFDVWLDFRGKRILKKR